MLLFSFFFLFLLNNGSLRNVARVKRKHLAVIRKKYDCDYFKERCYGEAGEGRLFWCFPEVLVKSPKFPVYMNACWKRPPPFPWKVVQVSKWTSLSLAFFLPQHLTDVWLLSECIFMSISKPQFRWRERGGGLPTAKSVKIRRVLCLLQSAWDHWTISLFFSTKSKWLRAKCF